MHLQTHKITPFGIGLALLLGAAAAQAAPTAARIGAQSFITPRGQFARLTVNDHPVATLHTSAGGYTPAERALVVKKRLTALLDAGLTPGQISLVKLNTQEWEIRGNGERLLLVTPQEARQQKQSAKRLAMVWAKSLKVRLAEPMLSLAKSQILIPYGQTRTLTVGGAALAGDIQLEGGNSQISPAMFDPRTRRMTLRGASPGEARLLLRAGDAASPLTVTVRKFAASVQTHVTVRVTGRPTAPASVVQNAVYLGLKHALEAEDGAQMRVLKAPHAVGSLRPGRSVTRKFAIRVAGPDLLPVEAQPTVTVVNQPLPPAKAEAIFYSNNPEQVKSSQTLFAAPLSPGQAVRLDYHHQNSSGGALIFHTDVVNTGDEPASVHLMAGVAEPQIDTVQVGRRAGAAFLRALDSGTGLVLDVPAHSRVPLVVQRFGNALTVSGILQVRQMSGADKSLRLRVVADGDRETLAASPTHLATTMEKADAPRLIAAPAGPLSTGTERETSSFVFGPPRVELTGTYTVGGLWTYLRLGHVEALKNAAGTQTLYGNYGVSYFVTLKVSNPSDRARKIGVFFAADAGLAAGVFQVSGEPIVEFDPMPPPEERQVTVVRLAPGEAKTVRIRTILLNGSAYPASLVIHAL